VRVFVEVRVAKIRDFSGMAMDFYDVGVFDISDVVSGAAFIDSQLRFERRNRISMHVKSLG